MDGLRERARRNLDFTHVPRHLRQHALDDLDAQADTLGTDLGLLGTLLVNVDPRWRITREYRDHLEQLDVGLFATVIPRRVGVTAHARYGRPAVLLEPDGVIAHAYRQVAAEMLGRLETHHGGRSTWNARGSG